MTSLAVFDDPERLAHWLMGAAAGYGATLRPDPQTGATSDDAARSATQLMEARAIALHPLSYSEEFSFNDHVLRAAGRRDAGIDAGTARGRLRMAGEMLDDALTLALRRWESRDGPEVLYMLLSLAARKRSDAALSAAREIFAKGRMGLLPENWKRAIGYQLTALAHAFARSLDGRQLLEDMPLRTDYWTASCSGMVCSGIVLNRPERWLPTVERFIDDLETLDRTVLRAQFQSVVNAASLSNVLVGTCTQLPVYWGLDLIEKPFRSERTVRVLEELFAAQTAPIDFHYWGQLAFACGDAEMILRDATMHDDVQRAFERLAREQHATDVDGEYIYHACAERFTILTGKSVNSPAAGIDLLASAVSDREILEGDDMGEPEVIDELLGDVDAIFAEAGLGSLDSAINRLAEKFGRLGGRTLA
ncbi:hypothetical protein SAMN05421759_102147 [Roseivivax lentus]|uniref:Uncharacterized protein n=1 Tax=Roseivivax lentus TaxID=633194 RepID=A0A1N7KWT5_9RHOB|nr:hypothetical protein [Roseivivax lentus]SIS66102.1 hypothetical protein SAMN05421759_102147 [Roseivivax lentus]